MDNINLATLRTVDWQISSIIHQAAYAHLFRYDPAKRLWDRANYHGPLFLCERKVMPRYSLVIVNQHSVSDHQEYLKENMCVRLRSSCIYVLRSDSSILSFAISNEKDSKSMFKHLSEITKSSNSSSVMQDFLLDVPPPEELAAISPAVVSNSKAESSSIEVSKARLEEDSPVWFHSIFPAAESTPNHHLSSKQEKSQTSKNVVHPANNHLFACEDSAVPVISECGTSKFTLDRMPPPTLHSFPQLKVTDNSLSKIFTGSERILQKDQLLLALLHLLQTDKDLINRLHDAYLNIMDTAKAREEHKFDEFEMNENEVEDEDEDLLLLSKRDSSIKSIVDKVPMAVVCTYINGWKKMKLKGPLFLCERSTDPHYCFILTDQNSSKRLTQYITPRLNIGLKSRSIYITRPNDDFAYALLLQKEEECRRMFGALKNLLCAVGSAAGCSSRESLTENCGPNRMKDDSENKVRTEKQPNNKQLVKGMFKASELESTFLEQRIEELSRCKSSEFLKERNHSRSGAMVPTSSTQLLSKLKSYITDCNGSVTLAETLFLDE